MKGGQSIIWICNQFMKAVETKVGIGGGIIEEANIIP